MPENIKILIMIDNPSKFDDCERLLKELKSAREERNVIAGKIAIKGIGRFYELPYSFDLLHMITCERTS